MHFKSSFIEAFSISDYLMTIPKSWKYRNHQNEDMSWKHVINFIYKEIFWTCHARKGLHNEPELGYNVSPYHLLKEAIKEALVHLSLVSGEIKRLLGQPQALRAVNLLLG